MGTNNSKKNFSLKVKKWVTDERTGALLLFIIVCVILMFTTDTFLTLRNLTNLTRYASFYVMVGVGVLVIFMSGEMDLSLGATMGMSGIMSAMLARDGQPLIVVLAVGIFFGILIGAFNGYLVGYWTFPAFIATLGCKQMIRGLITVITEGYPINDLSESFTYIGTGSFLGIPIPIYIAIFLAVLTWYILNKTVFGRHVVATGANAQAAIVSGINTKRIKLFSYMYGGALAGIAGMVLTARVTSGQVNCGDGFELDAIAGAIIGGASMEGGSGTVIGTICGIMVIYTVKNGMSLLSINAYWQQVAQGAIILLAIFLDIIRKKQRS